MAKNSILLLVAINLGAVMVAVLAFGAWKRLNPDQVDQAQFQTRMEGSIAVGGFFDQNIDDVGFIAAANKQVTARKMAELRVLFDVTYTTGPDHFRIVPEAKQAERCVLLFGDSFTFGEGVNDAETTAAQIVIKSNGRVAAKNFGIGGWGTAPVSSWTAVRAISARHLLSSDRCSLLAHSGARSARGGRGRWDTHGPRFRLDTGRPVRSGNFDTHTDWNWRQLVGLNALTEAEEDILTAALIAEAARELGRLYPGIRFHVFAWDGVMDGLVRLLTDREINVRHMREAIPDFSADEYLIASPVEGHPNARAYERLAALS